MELVIAALHRYVREKLFSPETGLIYDYQTSRDHAHRFDHLPCSDEVSADSPNPCGWGTGMEDCTLNAGLMLDTGLGRDRDFAAALVAGLHQVATVHGRVGFFARGISPRAPGLTYSNTSRDQLTLAVYGLWRQLHSAGENGELRQECAFLLQAAAADCRKFVTPANHYDLLRLDGKRGLVSQLWDCQAHEMLRLPMVYAAAFEATGAPEDLAAARSLMAEGVARTAAMDNQDTWWDLPTVQLQFSVRLLFECGFFPEYEAELRRILERIAAFARLRFGETLAEAEAYPGEWETLNENWRFRPFVLQNGSVAPDGSTSATGGKFYFNPVYPDAYKVPNSLLRRLGSWLTVLSAGGLAIPPGERARLRRLLGRIDLIRCGGDGPLRLLHGVERLV